MATAVDPDQQVMFRFSVALVRPIVNVGLGCGSIARELYREMWGEPRLADASNATSVVHPYDNIATIFHRVAEQCRV